MCRGSRGWPWEAAPARSTCRPWASRAARPIRMLRRSRPTSCDRSTPGSPRCWPNRTSNSTRRRGLTSPNCGPESRRCSTPICCCRVPDTGGCRWRSHVMRLVVATLKPSQVESVRQALAAVSVTRMTVCDAQGWQDGGGLRQQAILEIAVNDDFLEPTVRAITAALEAGGDSATGRLHALPIGAAVQLYREVRGPEAV
ncbi:MAG: P-II family nitrogen regulator [Planctomycetia bacterium]|nr:P-II family nitrogen regulator [Planctomycetia bacterium]